MLGLVEAAHFFFLTDPQADYGIHNLDNDEGQRPRETQVVATVRI